MTKSQVWENPHLPEEAERWSSGPSLSKIKIIATRRRKTVLITDSPEMRVGDFRTSSSSCEINIFIIN